MNLLTRMDAKLSRMSYAKQAGTKIASANHGRRGERSRIHEHRLRWLRLGRRIFTNQSGTQEVRKENRNFGQISLGDPRQDYFVAHLSIFFSTSSSGTTSPRSISSNPFRTPAMNSMRSRI